MSERAASARLDPAIGRLAAAMPGLSARELAAREPAELLRSFRAQPPASQPDPAVAEEDVHVPTRHGEVRIRVYRPLSGEASPVLVNLHGGGWVGGTIEQDDPRCRFLAREVRCAVLSVAYSLAPERPFPTALEECEDVFGWIVENARRLAVDASRIALCGSSSGGALAAALSLRLVRKGGPQPVGQVLTYPVCDGGFDYPSWQEFAEGYLLSADMMRWFWDQYAPHPHQRADPDAAPLRATDLAAAVPTLLVTAECDILRDEAEAYADRLAAAGAKVRRHRAPGVVHGFISLAPGLPQTRAALGECASFLRDVLR